MVKVICKNGKFLVKGTFDFGMIGAFKNEEFDEENIQISFGMDDLIEGMKEDYCWMNPLKKVFKDVPREPEAYAETLEKYINEREQFVKKNQKQIDDYFLYRLIENFVDCGYPFWETEQAILPKYKDKFTEEDYENIYDEHSDEIYELQNEFDDKPNDGSIEKTDVKSMIERIFPMFNLEGLIKSIKTDGMNFEGAYMEVQFSDGWGDEFYCSAYEEFDENLRPQDWHNF